MTSTVIFQY